jgi:acyl-CoA reductase-like NAD-dependent aldehyde dehydrogenase
VARLRPAHLVTHREIYVDGAWVPSSSAAVDDVVEPATGTAAARIPAGTAADVDRAVRAARAALADWAAGREPAGVVALLLPGAGRGEDVPDALAAGWTVVVAASGTAAPDAYRLFGRLARAGLPAGVANLVVGRPATVGEALRAHPGVDRVGWPAP